MSRTFLASAIGLTLAAGTTSGGYCWFKCTLAFNNAIYTLKRIGPG